MSNFVDMAMELLNIKNHVKTQDLQENLDSKHIALLEEIKNLNQKIDDCHVRIDLKEKEIRELVFEKQNKIEKLKDLFYKEL